MINVISLVLSLLTTVLGQVKGSTAAGAAELTQGLEAAIASLQAVQNTPVTFAQLESLRVEPKW